MYVLGKQWDVFAFSHSLLFYSSGSQPGVNLPSKEQLVISRDSFDYHDWEGAKYV